ncbi:50S ribosomal protein L21 [bacterium]|nr:50S ribosomal protein L21 [bacterium]
MATKASEKADWKNTQTFPYAVIRSGGKQYTVAPGDHINVEKLEVEPGATFVNEDVLMLVTEPGKTQIGKPTVSGAKVTFEVLQQGLGEKVKIRHHRRRHNSQVTRGHRQPFTRIEVKKIEG